MLNNKRDFLIIFFLVLLLAASVLVSLMFGGSRMNIGEIFAALINPHSGDTGSTILWSIRIPRIMLGIVVGAGLAVSGSVFQAILRNPLAEPYTLGISGGAAFGASIAIVTGIAARSILALPLFAFLGTVACILLVYAAASKVSFSTHTLILTGVILGFIFSSLVLLLFAVVNPSKIQQTIMWLMGDLSSAETGLIAATAIFVFAGSAVLFMFSRELDILTLGEEKAMHLGVEAGTVKKIVFVTASCITAACVSAAGIIGFVGLIMPHAVRRITGPNHRILIPASAAGGGIFIVLCDTFARTIIAPVELPIGVITGFTGGIFFLLFLARTLR